MDRQSVSNRTPVLLRFLIKLPFVNATGRWREWGRRMGGYPDAPCTQAAAPGHLLFCKGTLANGLTRRRKTPSPIRSGPRPIKSRALTAVEFASGLSRPSFERISLSPIRRYRP
jgi:hypothetical protein